MESKDTYFFILENSASDQDEITETGCFSPT